MDLPNKVETGPGDERLPVVLPTAEETETMQSIVNSMDGWVAEMKECAASGDLLRLLHLSATIAENNSWLAGYIDRVMDCRF